MGRRTGGSPIVERDCQDGRGRRDLDVMLLELTMNWLSQQAFNVAHRLLFARGRPAICGPRFELARGCLRLSRLLDPGPVQGIDF